MASGNSSTNTKPTDNDFDYSKVWALYKQKGKRIINIDIRKNIIDFYRRTGEQAVRKRQVVEALKELGYDRDTIEHYVDELYGVGALEIAKEDKKNVEPNARKKNGKRWTENETKIRYYRLVESLRGPVLPKPIRPQRTWIFDQLDLLKNEFLHNFRYFSHLTCDSGVMYAGQLHKVFVQVEYIKNKVKDKTSQETLQILDNLSAIVIALKDGFAEYAERGKKPFDFYEKIRIFLSRLQDLYNRAHNKGEWLDAPG